MLCESFNTAVQGNGTVSNLNSQKLIPVISKERTVSGSGEVIDIVSTKLKQIDNFRNINYQTKLPDIIQPTYSPQTIVIPTIQTQQITSNTIPTQQVVSTTNIVPNQQIISTTNIIPTPTTIPIVNQQIIPTTNLVSTQQVIPVRNVKFCEDNEVQYFQKNEPIVNQCGNVDQISDIDKVLGITKNTCHPKGAPWQLIIIAMVGSGMLLYTILMAKISESRRQFSLGVIILWTLLWVVIFWSLWRRCYTTVIWWLLLFSLSIITLFFVIIVALDLGSS